MKSGYVYIISNPAHPGWLKVGVTEDINARLHTYQTSDPQRAYKVEYYIPHPDPLTAEKKIKEMMHYFATRQRNEWYECDLQTAIIRLQEQVECED